MEQQKILKINFSHLSESDKTAQIAGNLILIDNLSSSHAKVNAEELITIPIKVTMAVLIFCRSGNIKLKLSMKEHEIKGSHMCLIPPGELLQLESISDDAECAIFAVNTDFMDFTKGVKTGLELFRILKLNPIYPLGYKEMAEQISLYESLKQKLLLEDYKFKEEVAKSYLNIIRCNLDQALSKQADPSTIPAISSRKEELFMQFISNVHMNYKTDRNVTFYADKLCVTPKYLSSVIHEVSGKYASDWIMEFVISEAKVMLRAEKRSVKDVCNTLNFANQSFFAKYFKHHTGYTPKEYKNLKW